MSTAGQPGILRRTSPRAEVRARLPERRRIPEGHVFRRLSPALLLLTIALAACSGQGPALTDPKEIITQGMQATSEATSLHLDLTVSGTLTIAETGGTFNLDGTTAGGDFDIANETARLTFSIPSVFGLSGEAIQIGTDSYVKTSLTGELYTKTTVEDGDVPTDPEQVFAQVESFLDEEGVVSEKLDDVSCGDRQCYAVRLTIPTSLLASAGDAAGVDASEFLGESLVLDLQFDREDLRLRQASTDIDAGEVGSFGLLVTFSNYDAAVEVSPPPDDLVTEDGGLPF
jgi:hypothetical protein